MWYWFQERQIGQWDRTEIPEIEPHLANWFLKRYEGNSVEKGLSFQEIVLEQLDVHRQKTRTKIRLKMNHRLKCKT